MNARERAKELAELFESHDNAYVAGVIRDLLAEIERLRGIEKQAHDECVRIAWLEYEVEWLEEKLETQKRAAWNHEGVSKDYTLAMQKVKSQGEQIDALTRQRDILAEAIQKALHDPYCADCSPTCEIQKECPTWLLSQALKDAGMGRNDDTRRIAEILWYR